MDAKGGAMSQEFRITNGPDKPALQWALAYPDTHTVHFDVENDAFDAVISRIDEQAGGLSFTLEGRLTSGSCKGSTFEAEYSVESRSGLLRTI
jgi:hypothetical protein